MASLRQRMLEDMQVRRLSACTQRTYVETVARFARYFDRSPARLGPEQIRAYQVYLTNERRLAPSSLVVAVSEAAAAACRRAAALALASSRLRSGFYWQVLRGMLGRTDTPWYPIWRLNTAPCTTTP